jgi:alanyl-tRNA synthetase
MTERLYYTDADLLDFDATVIDVVDTGGRPAVVLDRSAFYPTSGGQPHDVGRLGGVDVVDVVDDDARIIHVLTAPLSVGAAVHGAVGAARRLDHRQQHTGQHVLSAAFDRLFGNRTLSFHLGSDACTIDLDKAASPQDVERAVDEANRVVWDNRPVLVAFADAEQAASMGLRKPSSREGRLRLVEVSDFDLSACGGTHVARTGAIGIIAVMATEKFKGGLRVTFVCGGRALRTLRTLRDGLAGSIRTLSVLPAELPASIQKLQTDLKSTRKRVGELQVQLATHEARRLLAAGTVSGGVTVVGAILDGWDAAGLRAVASAVVREAPAIVVLASGSPALIAVGQSAGGPPASMIVSRLVEQFGGKGGGSPELAQGGGLASTAEGVLAAARALIRPT